MAKPIVDFDALALRAHEARRKELRLAWQHAAGLLRAASHGIAGREWAIDLAETFDAQADNFCARIAKEP